MEITLTDTKKQIWKLAAVNCSIRIIKVIGLIISSLSGVKYGAAHCKYLQRYMYFYKEGIVL